MKLTEKLILAMAFSAISLTTFAFDDPQTDHDSPYLVGSQSDLNDQEVVDVAALEIAFRTEDKKGSVVDPQTDYESVYMTDYLRSLEQ